MSQNPPSRCAPSIAAPLDLLIEMTCTRERVMIDSALLAALSDTDGVQEVRLWRLIGEFIESRPRTRGWAALGWIAAVLALIVQGVWAWLYFTGRWSS